jgi:hypothetical protein
MGLDLDFDHLGVLRAQYVQRKATGGTPVQLVDLLLSGELGRVSSTRTGLATLLASGPLGTTRFALSLPAAAFLRLAAEKLPFELPYPGLAHLQALFELLFPLTSLLMHAVPVPGLLA